MATPGMPGYISVSESKFDGSKQITIEPAWLYDSPIKLSLMKNTKMAEQSIILTVVVKGTHTFATGKSLHFNIDNEIVSFEAMDTFTDIETTPGLYNSVASLPASNWSSKRYTVTKDFINRIINANDVWVKVELTKTFVEGKFSSDAPTIARKPFKSFMEKINAW